MARFSLLLFLFAMQGLAADSELAAKDVVATYKIEGQIILPESSAVEHDKISQSRVLVDHSFKHVAFVRLVVYFNFALLFGNCFRRLFKRNRSVKIYVFQNVG